jgi:hypothetical protein
MEIDIWVRTSSMSTKMTDRGYATTHLPACGMIQPIAVPKYKPSHFHLYVDYVAVLAEDVKRKIH